MSTSSTSSLFDNDISETLLIPLWMRVEEQQQKKPLFIDHEAKRIADALPYDFSKIQNKKMSQVGTAIRVHVFDKITRELVAENSNTVVVHLGCGLDTRFSRTDNGNGIQIDVDLPKVIEYRDKLKLNQHPRNPTQAGSLLETDWIDALVERYPDRPIVFILEGVLMYFNEEQVKGLMQAIGQRVKKGYIAFDCFSSFFKKVDSKRHDTLRYFNAAFLWGVDDLGLIEQWSPTFKLKHVYYNMRMFFCRWGIYNLLRLHPQFSKGYRIVLYSIG